MVSVYFGTGANYKMKSCQLSKNLTLVVRLIHSAALAFFVTLQASSVTNALSNK